MNITYPVNTSITRFTLSRALPIEYINFFILNRCASQVRIHTLLPFRFDLRNIPTILNRSSQIRATGPSFGIVPLILFVVIPLQTSYIVILLITYFFCFCKRKRRFIYTFFTLYRSPYLLLNSSLTN